MKYIFKIFNILVGLICAVSVCAVDSPSWIPTIVFVVTFGYLAAIALRKGEEEYDEI